MPIVSITLIPGLSREQKDKIAKKITEILAEEEKKTFKVDTTAITAVVFTELPMDNIYLGTNRLEKVIETLPKT